MKLRSIIVATGLFLCLLAANVVSAMTIAVLPIEDLSRGQNGVNPEMTDYLAWELNQRGFDVIDQDAVIDFLARNRVRWLGFLDTRHIIQAREELGADLILFGTISLRQEDVAPTLGLSLYLVRTDDTRTLWTGSGGISQADLIRILDLGEKKDVSGLMALLGQRVMEKWPEDYVFVAKQQPPLEIEKVALGPEHIRRGEKVSCEVRLRTRWAEEDMPRIFFKAGGRVHLARQSKDGFTYSAQWRVDDRDGRYPVTMVINWPSGRRKVSFLGSYSVDSAPPRLVLELKGIKLEGTVAFRDKVIIIPRMLRREPVARWRIKVKDENGEEQMSYNGYGNLPMRFVWNGRGKDGWPAAEGIYKVELEVWDRAGNRSVATENVAVARTPPSMVLEAKNRGRDLIIDLNHEGKVPIAFWRMEMRNEKGEVVKVAEGDQLPAREVIKVANGKGVPLPKSVVKVAKGFGRPLMMDVAVPDDNKKKTKLACTVVIRDVLGNETRKEIDDLERFAQGEKSPADKDKDGAPAWIEEF